MHWKRNIYHSKGIDESNMGEIHFEMNVYQSQCPNIGDYDIIYGSTQISAYCGAN
jgi:hypothetical protein